METVVLQETSLEISGLLTAMILGCCYSKTETACQAEYWCHPDWI